MSSATGTACESKHEDTYIAWVAHTKTLRKGCKHSTHCAMVQSQYVCAQQMTRLYNPCKHMAEQNGHVQLRPHVPAALGRLYDSAIREGTVQTTRCNHTRDCVCLFACTATYNYTTVQAGRPGSSEVTLKPSNTLGYEFDPG